MKKNVIMLLILCCTLIFGSTMVSAAETDYEIQQPIVRGTANSIVLTWKNPAVSTISDIKLYDITNGKTEISFTANKTANVRNEVVVSGLTGNATYKYLIEISFSDHNTVTYQFYGQTVAANRYSAPPSWMWGTLSEKTEISTVVEADGNTAARLTSNRGHWSESGVLCIIQNIASNAGKKYKTKFSYKSKNAPNFHVRLFWGNTSNVSVASQDWTDYEVEFVASNISQENYMFYTTAGEQDFYIDNVELYLYDDATGEYGDNLIVNGTFEEGFGAICSDVTNANKVEKDGQVNISWQNPSEAIFLHSRVYIKSGNDLLLRGELPANESSMTLTNLNNEETYEIVIKAVDKYGRETSGVVLQAVPTAPDYEISELVSSNIVDGEIIPGDIYCVFQATNNKLIDGLKVQSLVITYNDDKTINNVFSSGPVTVSKGVQLPVDCLASVSNLDSYVEVYIWSSLADMDVLVPHKVYNVKK